MTIQEQLDQLLLEQQESKTDTLLESHSKAVDMITRLADLAAKQADKIRDLEQRMDIVEIEAKRAF